MSAKMQSFLSISHYAELLKRWRRRKKRRYSYNCEQMVRFCIHSHRHTKLSPKGSKRLHLYSINMLILSSQSLAKHPISIAIKAGNLIWNTLKKQNLKRDQAKSILSSEQSSTMQVASSFKQSTLIKSFIQSTIPIPYTLTLSHCLY